MPLGEGGKGPRRREERGGECHARSQGEGKVKGETPFLRDQPRGQCVVGARRASKAKPGDGGKGFKGLSSLES